MDANNKRQSEARIKQLNDRKAQLYNSFENFKYTGYARFFQLGTCVFIAVCIPLFVTFFSKPENGQPNYPIWVPLVFIFGGFLNIFHVREISLNVRKIREINEELGINTNTELREQNILRPVQDTINLMQIAYIIGTILSGTFWFVYPDKEHLEPLTFVLGFGTALFAYFREQLKTPLIDWSIEADEQSPGGG